MAQPERTPPHNLDAERAVLGAPLISPRSFRERIAMELVPDDFFLPAHREVFEAYHVLDRGDLPIDVISLAEELKRRGSIPRLEGGEGYLVQLANTVPTAENVGYYVDVVKDKANARRVLSLCAMAQQRIYEGAMSSEVLEEVSFDVSKIVTGRTTNLIQIGSLVPGLMNAFEERARREPDQKLEGVRFGLEELDDLIFGLRPGNQCFIAAGVGGGKTSLGIQAVLTHVLVDGGASIVFSMEMTKEELAERAFAHLGRVNSHLLRRGQLDYEDYKSLTSVATKLVTADIVIDDQSNTLRQFQANARRWRAANPDKRGLAVFDFIQLSQQERYSENRARFIGAMAYGIKAIAKDLGIAVITVSQLTREGVKKGPDGKVPKPDKNSLKESGDLEAAADQIVLIHNEDETEDGPVDIILGKNRHGMCRTVRAQWVGRHYLFKSLGDGSGGGSGDTWSGRRDLD